MTSLAEHIIVAGAENRPPMLEKSMYDSWASCIHLFIKGKKHGRMMLDSIDNETNIILHGLPPDVYALVNNQEAAKDIWHRVKMLMKVQVNNKFLNALPSKWSKFITDVKLAKSLYTTNYDQLYAYLSPHERHANEVRISRERYPDSFAFIANSPILYNPSQSPQHSASRFPPSNNQLRTLSNPRNQATIQDGRVIVQQVQGRQNQSYAGTRNRGIDTISKGNVAVGPQREKLMLPEAQEVGQILDEEQLAFLADPDCDELSLAKAGLMANLSSCDPKVLSETLILDEESRSKMLDKQNDSISIEKKIKISPIDYSKLKKIKEYFGKCFVTQKELSAEQAFWLKHSTLSETPVTLHTPVRIKVPIELPKSVESSDLNAQLQEKVFAITSLKNELRKLKGKNIINTMVSKPNATISPRMFKLDIEPISARLTNNMNAHEVYIDKTLEYADTLCGFVE
ncbi:hypothetical protein Tco_1532615 [Tanacetum coccineum]